MIADLLKLLIIEDSLTDAELVIKFLKRSGLQIDHTVVDSRKALIETIQQNNFDIVLSDHSFPQFSSNEALRIIKDTVPDLPFIIVTGTVSEEFAVSILQDGADDYILKNNLSRLPSAIENALEIRRMKREQAKAENALYMSVLNYRTLFEQASAGIFITDQYGNFLDANYSACMLSGYTHEELLKLNMKDLLTENVRGKGYSDWADLSSGNTVIYEQEIVKKDGSSVPAEINVKHLPDGRYQTMARDITERKKWEEKLKASHEELRLLASHLQNIREKERSAIAREIHDELGQQLTGLKMDISWLAKKIKTDDESIKEKINTAIELINETIKTVRKIATDLRPGILDDLGLIEALRWYSQEFEKRYHIKVNFHETIGGLLNISKDHETGLFRIYQESLTNVARHAEATNINTEFSVHENTLVLTISDNGKGFDTNKAAGKQTLGLLGMKERALMINGSYTITSTPGKGTIVQVSVDHYTNKQ